MEELYIYVSMLILGGVITFSLQKRWQKEYVLVNEMFVGLKYEKGQFIEVLPPGHYPINKKKQAIKTVFMGLHFLNIAGQDILTAEQVQIKISLLLAYEIADPVIAMHRQENLGQVIYWQAQIVLRETLSKTSLNECLQNPLQIQQELLPLLQTRLAEMGILIKELYLKDIMLSGELKRAYNKLLLAQKESQTAIEKARGEQATLRSLSNAARQLNNNPALQQLRWLHAIENSKTPHTVHLHIADSVNTTE